MATELEIAGAVALRPIGEIAARARIAAASVAWVTRSATDGLPQRSAMRIRPSRDRALACVRYRTRNRPAKPWRRRSSAQTRIALRFTHAALAAACFTKARS
jgi:hypothetical protein